MASFDDEYHRTLVQMLVDTDNRELASALVDGGATLLRDQNGSPYGIALDIPSHAYTLISGNESLKQTLVRLAKRVAAGHLFEDYGQPIEDTQIQLRVQMMVVEDNWRAVVRDLIVNYKATNQATVSRLIAERDRRQLLKYNEASYASQSEIKIAMELEQRQVLFFPLALAVRADTGESYRDHREADFLVCDDGGESSRFRTTRTVLRRTRRRTCGLKSPASSAYSTTLRSGATASPPR
jgi:hypothetical protein